MADTPTPAFDYKIVNISNLEVTMNKAEGKRPATVANIILDGEPLVPSGRFWESLYANYGLNKGFFKFFSHNEVFRRISERAKDSRVRLCIDRTAASSPILLAVSNVKKPVLLYDDMLDIIKRFEVTDIKYDRGVIRSTHMPRIGADPFSVAGDKFANRFEVLAPIDGYGAPDVYLSMMRLICQNGMIGFARAFRTTLSFLGTTSGDVRNTIARALDAFNNEEGYAALRERFEVASNSWASIREASELYQAMVKLSYRGGIQDPDTSAEEASAAVRALSGIRKEDWMQGKATPILKALSQLTGDPLAMFMSDPNKLTMRKQRILPVACKVYDLINFATEVASHHTTEEGTRYLQAWVGGMLRDEFDLEESCDRFNEFRDFFLKPPTAN